MQDGRRTGTTATAYTGGTMTVEIPTNEPLAAGPLEAYRKLDDVTLASRIDEVRQRLGSRVLILGHHYQQDGVIAHADLRGDSYQLSKSAAERTDCEAIVFCGVHFMAETADILVNRPEQVASRNGARVNVVLPDTAAGCSMADMAAIEQVEDAWADLGDIIDTDDITPVTYINSAASLKAFCGRHGGIVCTSSNARAILEWAFSKTKRVLFFPDQHLGRNTAHSMGVPLEQMCVWNPHDPRLGGNDSTSLEKSQVILWQGHCSVHAMFRPEHVDTMRENIPNVKVLVHPECAIEVVEKRTLPVQRVTSSIRYKVLPLVHRGQLAQSFISSDASNKSIPNRPSDFSHRRFACVRPCTVLIWHISVGVLSTLKPEVLSM